VDTVRGDKNSGSCSAESIGAGGLSDNAVKDQRI